MRALSRRHLLALLGASGLVTALPWSGRAWATQTPAPWTGGAAWIVGTGSLALHLQAALAPIENLQARIADTMAHCGAGRNDVVLRWVEPPQAPVAPRIFGEQLLDEVEQLRDAGATPILLGADVEDGAQAWSLMLSALADKAGVPLIDLNTVSVDPDAARVQSGPAGLARGIVRRLGLLLPLREAGAPSQLRPIGLRSPSCDKVMPALAYVPDQVPAGGLPVLYLLHGAWGRYSDWSLAAHEQLLALAAEHRLILVLPHGEPFGWYLDSPLVADSQIRTHLIDELVPHVDATLPTSKTRAIGGLSMGGHGAVLLALQHPGLFQAASSMSGAIDITHVPKSKQITRLLGPFSENEARWVAHSASRQLSARVDVARQLPLRLTCGTADIWFQTNREVHDKLERLSVPHVWKATEGAGHTWAYWLEQLPEHVAWHATHLHAPEAP